MSVDPKGEIDRVKVLSTGRLQGKMIECIAPGKYKIEQDWRIREDLFTNYSFQLIRKPAETLNVLCFDPQNSILELSGNITDDHTGNEFEIYAEEEAVVLATRMVTKTRLADELPKIDTHLYSRKGTGIVSEDKGIRPLLVTTRGFRDTDLNHTQQDDSQCNLNIKQTYSHFDRVTEVDERIDIQGKVLVELNESKINTLLREVFGFNPGLVFVVLMNSDKNQLHEKILFNVLKTAGIHYVYASYMRK
jgi:5-oxoprolinase (ATP-hydrolysing)